MIVDGLVLVGENRFGASLQINEVLWLAEEVGIDVVVAAPARPLGYHLEPANTSLAEVARLSGGRLKLLGRLDPLNGSGAVAEAERCLDDLGCVGLFLHPGEEAFPILRAVGVLEVARDRNAPVVVATGYLGLSEPLQVAQLAGNFPRVPIVMTTGGQINISGLGIVDARNALMANPNLYVMTNGEYRQDFIEELAQVIPDRVIYGSFAPFFDFRFEFRRVRSATMSRDARLAIEGRNAAHLFGLRV